MKKRIFILTGLMILMITTAASASDTIKKEDPMSMEAWQQYAQAFGFDTTGGYDTKDSVRKEVLEDFNGEDLYEQLLVTWGLESGEAQIFGFRFEDSESAKAMLSCAEELSRDKEQTVREEEETYTLVRFAPPASGEDSPWYLDLLQYGNDFVYIEICDETGDMVLEKIMERALSSAGENNSGREDQKRR